MSIAKNVRQKTLVPSLKWYRKIEVSGRGPKPKQQSGDSSHTEHMLCLRPECIAGNRIPYKKDTVYAHKTA